MTEDDVNKRLSALEQHQAVIVAEQVEIKAEQRATLEQITTNTAAIQSVKGDTEELIALLKGSKVFAQVLKWAVGIVASPWRGYGTDDAQAGGSWREPDGANGGCQFRTAGGEPVLPIDQPSLRAWADESHRQSKVCRLSLT